MNRPARHPLRGEASFSLIEVVLALGIVSFAIIAILGLFSAGLKVNKESLDQIQAANISSLLLSVRRASPTDASTNLDSFALPHLDQDMVSGTVNVGLDGTTTNSTPAYHLYYTVGTNADTGANVANVYLRLWPYNIPTPQTNNPGSYYEVFTQVKLQ